jgi:hypothetical protein
MTQTGSPAYSGEERQALLDCLSAGIQLSSVHLLPSLPAGGYRCTAPLRSPCSSTTLNVVCLAHVF